MQPNFFFFSGQFETSLCLLQQHVYTAITILGWIDVVSGIFVSSFFNFKYAKGRT